MQLILQRGGPGSDAFPVGTTQRLQNFVAAAFTAVGLDWREHLVSDPEFARPNELRTSRANPAKAQARLAWKANHAMADVVRLMIEAEGKGGDG